MPPRRSRQSNSPDNDPTGRIDRAFKSYATRTGNFPSPDDAIMEDRLLGNKHPLSRATVYRIIDKAVKDMELPDDDLRPTVVKYLGARGIVSAVIVDGEIYTPNNDI